MLGVLSDRIHSCTQRASVPLRCAGGAAMHTIVQAVNYACGRYQCWLSYVQVVLSMTRLRIAGQLLSSGPLFFASAKSTNTEP